jgi:hypothetical protein
MKLISLGYHVTFVVADEQVTNFVGMLGSVMVGEGNDVKNVEFEVKDAPDFAYEIMKAQALKEVTGKIKEECEQYKGWWLNGHGEIQKLKAQIKELKEGSVPIEQEIPF